MKKPIITRAEVRQFSYQISDVAPDPIEFMPIYQPGSVFQVTPAMIRIFTDAGITGEYLCRGVAEYTLVSKLFPKLIGRNALDREAIYNEARHVFQQSAPTAISAVDVALWDLAGKFYETPVYELLGGYRTAIPCYASTYSGERQSDGLNSPEAFAEFAQQCLELGYRGYKTHPWTEAPISEWIATNDAIAKQVGGKIDLMVDAHCALNTFGDALKLGYSCDDNRFFLWEDPFISSGMSSFAARKLRQLVRTPLLQMEHIRGLESHVDFIVADGTDFVRGDIEHDGGITGVMKLAHVAEGFGLDMEMHLVGPAERHVLGAIRNTNYYEMGLLHPKAPWYGVDVYKCDYRDGLDAIDKNGCVPVPQGPGLGVEYDWEYINKHTVSVVAYP